MTLTNNEQINYLTELAVSVRARGRAQRRTWEGAGGEEISADGLLVRPGVAVADCFGPAGEVFPWHKHDETEIFVVYSGAMTVEVAGGATSFLNVGDTFSLEPDTAHKVYFVENCQFIAMTIPADPGYPDAG